MSRDPTITTGRSGPRADPDTGAGRGRPVGSVALLALGVNGIVGVGIFFAPADIARGAPGGSSVLVFVVTALLLAPVAVVFATLGRRFDEDGGPVVFARAAFGELASFSVGWVAYVSAIASTAAVIAGLTASVAQTAGLRGTGPERLGATALLTATAIVCAAGISLSARVWTALTLLKLAPLVALAAVFLVSGSRVPPAEPALASASWLRAALTATFTYQGFEVVPVIAGQVRSSATAIPVAVAGSLGLAALLYVVLQSACVAALPGLASSAAPLADAASIYGGEGLAWLVRWGTNVSALGIAFGMVAVTPRYLAALARHKALGLDLDHMAANGVPLRALAVTWLLVASLLQAGSRGELFALSSVAVLMQYVVAALSLLALSMRRERGLRPAHAWPVLPTIGIGLALVSAASGREWAVAAIALALGFLMRAAFRAKRGA